MTMRARTEMIVRERIIIEGVVQGVGFRPFVYGLAVRLGLCGFVGNDSGGVFVEVEGNEGVVEAFRERVVAEVPPLAVVVGMMSERMDVVGDEGFVIVASEGAAAENTLISPDTCVCDDCLRELRDPADRRYRYPFINCTNCGPRFTIIRDIPYDRPLTTMADFEMCAACQAEYDDPLDRRFHAQPNGCAECGPQVWGEWAISNEQLAMSKGIGEDAFGWALEVMRGGGILAVKGLGGFHLACDARRDGALATLRERKGRVDKPFGVMALDVETVEGVAIVGEDERRLLEGKERPMVLLRKRPDSELSDLIAPGNNYIGVMLPYTPLHYLLLEEMPVLVMTSANYSSEPIVKDNEEARERLAGLADGFLLHDRLIENRCDDAVVRPISVGESRLLPIRRSRGYAPFPVRLARETRPILAVGGELKATFCLTKGEFGYMSQHIGDMENWETLEAFGSAVRHFEHLFRVDVEGVACDLHPGYLGTGWAWEYAAEKGVPLIEVQHHEAHIASVMAEHRLGEDEQVIGFAFDGTGYGLDGAIWGGEVLVGGYGGFERPYHLAYTPLAGGDASVKRPYRLALAQLWAAGIDWDERLPAVQACPAAERKILRQQLERDLNCVPTSSMGRLFDGVAALAGGRQMITYEGQAAIELEAVVDASVREGYEFEIGDWEILAAPVIKQVVADVKNGVALPVIGAKFHNGVAEMIVEVSERLRGETGLNVVALSGGVFQNVTLLEKAVRLLEGKGFRPLIHEQVPPNDGGLALGQAVLAERGLGRG